MIAKVFCLLAATLAVNAVNHAISSEHTFIDWLDDTKQFNPHHTVQARAVAIGAPIQPPQDIFTVRTQLAVTCMKKEIVDFASEAYVDAILIDDKKGPVQVTGSAPVHIRTCNPELVAIHSELSLGTTGVLDVGGAYVNRDEEIKVDESGMVMVDADCWWEPLWLFGNAKPYYTPNGVMRYFNVMTYTCTVDVNKQKKIVSDKVHNFAWAVYSSGDGDGSSRFPTAVTTAGNPSGNYDFNGDVTEIINTLPEDGEETIVDDSIVDDPVDPVVDDGEEPIVDPVVDPIGNLVDPVVVDPIDLISGHADPIGGGRGRRRGWGSGAQSPSFSTCYTEPRMCSSPI